MMDHSDFLKLEEIEKFSDFGVMRDGMTTYFEFVDKLGGSFKLCMLKPIISDKKGTIFINAFSSGNPSAKRVEAGSMLEQSIIHSFMHYMEKKYSEKELNLFKQSNLVELWSKGDERLVLGARIHFALKFFN